VTQAVELARRRRSSPDSGVAFTVTPDVARRWLLARAEGSLSITDVTDFLRTARASIERRMWPLLVDARSCRTSMTPADVAQAVDIVRRVAEQRQQRAHVALVADDDRLYAWFLDYEAGCAALGVRVIRVFRQYEDAQRWLEIVSAARELG
jgi:hypothetical protein